MEMRSTSPIGKEGDLSFPQVARPPTSEALAAREVPAGRSFDGRAYPRNPKRLDAGQATRQPGVRGRLRRILRAQPRTSLSLGKAGNALVICVNEKSRCQALERAQPMLPMGFGQVEGVTHDYRRHGNHHLVPGAELLNGALLAACKPRHRHQEFLCFLPPDRLSRPHRVGHPLHRRQPRVQR
jgi:hypothetical protein